MLAIARRINKYISRVSSNVAENSFSLLNLFREIILDF